MRGQRDVHDGGVQDEHQLGDQDDRDPGGGAAGVRRQVGGEVGGPCGGAGGGSGAAREERHGDGPVSWSGLAEGRGTLSGEGLRSGDHNTETVSV